MSTPSLPSTAGLVPLATAIEEGFRWPWLMVALLWLVALVLGVTLARWLLARRRTAPEDAAFAAHTERLRRLPRFTALVRRRTALGAACTLAALVACSGAVLVAGRWSQTRTTAESVANRDIVLCLDASGSMAPIDAEVVAQFREIVAGLEGERIGLTIWNGVAITVFPLTDDYAFAQEQLAVAETAFADAVVLGPAYEEFVAGTVVEPGVASQLADGLVSCVQRFDRDDEERSRAIVLASDNEPYGRGVYTFDEATAVAEERGVVVHGVAAPLIADRPYADAEFRRQVERTGGTYSTVGSDGGAEEIVESIDALEASKIERPPVVQVLDQPRTGIVLTAVGVVLLGVVWAVQAAYALAARRGPRGRP